MYTTAEIFNIQHFSLNDGPGIRTVVFFKGCPLNCIWCHNPESKSAKSELSFLKEKCKGCQKCVAVCQSKVHFFNGREHIINRDKCSLCGSCADVCPESVLKILGNSVTVDEIMAEIAVDDMFFADTGGVTFSGGEPFMQWEALEILLRECKKSGYSTCIETSGFTDKAKILTAAKYTDYFLYDFKETDPALHKKYVGASNKTVLDNLRALNVVGANIILRCPIIPRINDREEHFKGISELCKSCSAIKSVELMPYHPLGISKAEQIGKPSEYQNPDFADKKSLNEYIGILQKCVSVPVAIG